MKNVQINKVPFLIGLGIFIVCFGIRLIGIGWGLPTENRYHSLHPDEELILAYSQAIQPAQGKFTPGFYNYGTLYLTIQKIVTDMVTAYGGGPQKEDGSDRHLAVRNYLLAGRIVSSIAGALAALAIFLAVSRHTHWIGGLLGAIAMGLTPALVVHSRFQTVDVIATCFLAWCFYQCSRIVPVLDEEIDLKMVQKATILASVFAGLSAGTKYTGVLALVAILVTLFVALKSYKSQGFIKLAAMSIGTVALVFVLGTPGVLLDSAKFVDDFKYEMTHTSTGHGLVFAGTASGWIYHIKNLVVGYGGVLLIFSMAGMGKATFKKQAWLIGPLIFAILVYILIGRAEVKFLRYTFPLIPVLAMGFGWLMGQAHLNGTNKSKALVAFGIVSLAGFGGGLVSTVTMTKWMTESDVRDVMARFIFNNIPRGSSIGIVQDPWFYTPTYYPQVQGGPAQYGGEPNIQLRLDLMKQVTDFNLIRYVPEDVHARIDWDVRLLTEEKPDFITFSSFEYEGVEHLYNSNIKDAQFALQVERYASFVEKLKEDYEPVTVVLEDGMRTPLLGFDGQIFTQKVHDLMYIRPEIWIWKRKDLKTPLSGTSTPSK